MIQLQPVLMRGPRVVGILFAFVLSLMLMIGCDHTGKGSTSQAAELRADFADDKTCFVGLDSIKVVVVMNEDAKDILSEQRAKDKFELTLRRHGVPLSDLSNPYLALVVEVLWNGDKTRATYTLSVSLRESLIFYRNNKPHRRFVNLWEDSAYGYAGDKVAKEAFIGAIEEKAERVANLYLSAN